MTHMCPRCEMAYGRPQPDCDDCDTTLGGGPGAWKDKNPTAEDLFSNE